MGYRYIEDIVTADVAFEARANTLKGVFVSAAEALLNTMVINIDSVSNQTSKNISVESDSKEMLLFDFLQELIFFKDSEQLLLRLKKMDILESGTKCSANFRLCGERINPEKHDLAVDVKAITMHLFGLTQKVNEWVATVVLDV
jgi:SHS2 domain-containing protein